MKSVLSYMIKKFWSEYSDGICAILIVVSFSAMLAVLSWPVMKHPDARKMAGKIGAVILCLYCLVVIRYVVVYIIDLVREAITHCRGEERDDG